MSSRLPPLCRSPHPAPLSPPEPTHSASRPTSDDVRQLAELKYDHSLFTDHSPNWRYLKWDLRHDKAGAASATRVYKAWDAFAGKEVEWHAVALHSLALEDVHKLESELATRQTLRHPNVTHVETTWTTDEDLVFITPLSPQHTLHDFMQRHGGMKLRVIKRIWWQILSALQYLHLRFPHALHMDAHCSSILYDYGSGAVKLGGLKVHELLRARTRASTCPECARRNVSGSAAPPGGGIASPTAAPASQRCACAHTSEVGDVAAFGSIVWEMLWATRCHGTGCAQAKDATMPQQMPLLPTPRMLEMLTMPQLHDFARLCVQQRVSGAASVTVEQLMAHPLLVDADAPTEDEEDLWDFDQPTSPPLDVPQPYAALCANKPVYQLAPVEAVPQVDLFLPGEADVPSRLRLLICASEGSMYTMDVCTLSHDPSVCDGLARRVIESLVVCGLLWPTAGKDAQLHRLLAANVSAMTCDVDANTLVKSVGRWGWQWVLLLSQAQE